MLTPTEKKLLDTFEAAFQLTSAIKQAIRAKKPSDKELLAALALRINLCNSPENHWIVKDAINYSSGEVFQATSSYWQCGSKLCPSCIRAQSRRSRKKLREAMGSQQLKAGERYYFVTLTVPNPRRSLLVTREIVNDAWVSFRRRKTFVDLVIGGVKSEEFTLTTNGYHYHLHLIIRSKYIRYNDFRRCWTESLDSAFTKAKIDYAIKTTDGLAIINLQPLKPNEGAIQEVCKYVTKSDSWTKMPQSELLDIARIERWPRMFELFGSFKPSPQASGIVHTTDLSVISTAFKLPYWRRQVESLGLERYSLRLIKEVHSAREFRAVEIQAKWPNSKVEIAASLFRF